MEMVKQLSTHHQTIIQGFWHGPDLGPLRQACLASFCEHGHVFELYTYGDLSVPHGVILRDANEIIPHDKLFYYPNPISGRCDLGPFSDLFRFKLLFERGGWWSDVDTVCISSEIPNVDRAWARESPKSAPDSVGTSQIAFSKGDAVVKLLYERCNALSKSHYPKRESLGPILLSDTIKNLELPKDVFGQPNTFYPISWIEAFKLWLPDFTDEITTRVKQAIFMPIYQSFSQYIGLTKIALPPSGSYLGNLCDKYGYEGVGRFERDEILVATKNFFLSQRNWAIEELRVVGGDSALELLSLKH